MSTEVEWRAFHSTSYICRRGRMGMNINREFLTQHDIDWPNLTYEGGFRDPDEMVHGCRQYYRREWNNGAFIGNGMVGAMIYKEDAQTLRWELGRNDVVAHNFLEKVDWAVPRVPIGDLLLIPAGTVTEERMHLHLWDAQASGTIRTDRGAVEWTTIADRNADMVLIEIRTAGGEGECRFGFRPEHGVSPRIRFAHRPVRLSELPPPPVQIRRGDVDLSIQRFVSDTDARYTIEGCCCVARREIVISADHRILVCSITNSVNEEASVAGALGLVESVEADTLPKIYDAHRSWWHEYYALSGLSVPGSAWESFYWRQVYKIASAMRAGGVVLDSQGPWLTNTSWPTTVWNLNVQLCYSPLVTSNRLGIGEALARTVADNTDALRNNARKAGFSRGLYLDRATNPVDLSMNTDMTHEVGNLTWILFCLWREYRATMDGEFLEKTLYPLMAEHFSVYAELLEEADDGTLHLTRTSSPEYPSTPGVNWYPILDCTFSLALLRWLCATLIRASAVLGTAPNAAWRETLDRLTDFPTDDTGFRVGAEVPYSVSHRHFSHLFMIYPLRLLDFEDGRTLDLCRTSIETWIGHSDLLQGYSFTAAANLAATLKDGNRALEYLNGLLEYVHPNTMYSESGPVIETPLSAMESVHDMVLQSWSGIIEVFPAVPDRWKEVAFDRFLAEGAVEVSARRENGVTVGVEILAQRGGRVRIRPGIYGDEAVYDLALNVGERRVFTRDNPDGAS